MMILPVALAIITAGLLGLVVIIGVTIEIGHPELVPLAAAGVFALMGRS